MIFPLFTLKVLQKSLSLLWRIILSEVLMAQGVTAPFYFIVVLL